ncbi:MAG: YbaK/EbsC family protein [Solirubrobacterales bacterium]|nr:YbaK/EbsC family protein [Solirubrobacterales bacterium]
MRAKVIDKARDLGLDVSVHRLDQGAAAVADSAAAAVGCAAEQVASCAVLVADGEPLVCVTPAGCEPDRDRVADALDVAEVRPASAGETRAATGFPAGGVPPFGHGLPVVLDSALLAHETVLATGGDGSTLVEVAPRHLVSCTEATVAAVARASA